MAGFNVGTMPARIQMLTTADQFQDKVMRAIHSRLNKKLGSAALRTEIRRGVNNALRDALTSHETYQSMIQFDGQLRRELGVVDSESAMNSLVRDWLRSTDVRFFPPRRVGNNFAGTVILLRSIQADYDDVLNQVYASYTTNRGQQIPWLQWLLKEGSEILVSTHRVSVEPTARTSRTGTNTIMVKTKGSGWGVPEKYAGTPDDNYATQSIVKAMPKIEQLFQDAITRRL